MSDSTWSDPKVAVAIYAAIVSTITFIWNIVLLIVNSRRKVTVKNTMHQVWYNDALSGSSPVAPHWGFEITNIGKTDLYIKSVGAYFNGKKIQSHGIMADGFAEIDRTSKTKFPHLLKQGEVYKSDFEVKGLVQEIAGQLRSKEKLRFRVYDTLGKRYLSKNIRFEFLEAQIKVAEEVNKGQPK